MKVGQDLLRDEIKKEGVQLLFKIRGFSHFFESLSWAWFDNTFLYW